jgi:hypothetical protein
MIPQPRPEGTTTMHPAIEYELIKARIADLRRQAEQHATARATLRARQGQTPGACTGLPG